MTELVLYTNPMSRGRVARWMLEEVGVPYETVLLEYGTTMKAPDYLALNPMGKVPTLKHGDAIVTETGAICAYLADAFPEAGLAPAPRERTAYYRWMFFAAGPLEYSATNKALGFECPPERRAMMGYSSLETAIDMVANAIGGSPYIAGDRFTAADVYVGSVIGWLTRFGVIPSRPVFDDYLGRIMARDAYQRASQIDGEMQHPAANAA